MHTFNLGDCVKVLDGPFNGRQGRVQILYTNDTARVQCVLPASDDERRKIVATTVNVNMLELATEGNFSQYGRIIHNGRTGEKILERKEVSIGVVMRPTGSGEKKPRKVLPPWWPRG